MATVGIKWLQLVQFFQCCVEFRLGSHFFLFGLIALSGFVSVISSVNVFVVCKVMILAVYHESSMRVWKL